MDEVIKLANEENIELTDDQLEFLASGGCSGECKNFLDKCANFLRFSKRKQRFTSSMYFF